MAFEGEVYFLIENGPGPSVFMKNCVDMFETGPAEKLMTVDFTVVPFLAGKKLLGHARKFKIPFEVVLLGVTTKYSYGFKEPRPVRLLGCFLMPMEVLLGDPPFVSSEAAAVLNSYEWEVVFRSGGREGLIARLPEPLTRKWAIL